MLKHELRTLQRFEIVSLTVRGEGHSICFVG
jgi:hypothetical protein